MPADGPIVDAVAPQDAWQHLEKDPDARLIDVRTRAEWTFVGLPDLGPIGREVWPIEWVGFPAMSGNPHFLEELEAFVVRQGGPAPERLFFICRSGARSLSAARTVAGAWSASGRTVHCTNVAEGFEGDLDGDGHRGRTNGWKVRGLPWRQS